jgi:hypothetical protein
LLEPMTGPDVGAELFEQVPVEPIDVNLVAGERDDARGRRLGGEHEPHP